MSHLFGLYGVCLCTGPESFVDGDHGVCTAVSIQRCGIIVLYVRQTVNCGKQVSVQFNRFRTAKLWMMSNATPYCMNSPQGYIVYNSATRA